jgi:hypothetical protein
MFHRPSLLIGFLAFFAWSAQAAPSEQQLRERLNQIFYWRLADELKLTPKEEKDLIQVIEDTQKKREIALAERDSALKTMHELKEGDVKNRDESLSRYEKSLQKLSESDIDEHKKLRNLLGAGRLARYYVIRDTVLAEIKKSALKK